MLSSANSRMALVERLIHTLSDVRCRALHSVKAKLQQGLLHLDGEADGLLAGLLGYLRLPCSDGEAALALEVLTVLASQPAAAAKLLEVGGGADGLLAALQQVPACAVNAELLLGEVLCARAQAPCSGPPAAERQEERPPAGAVGQPPAGTHAFPVRGLHSLASSPQQAAGPACPQPAERSPEVWSILAVRGPSCLSAPAIAACHAPAPASSMQLLGQLGPRVHRVRLGEEDEQQLFEIVVQLQPTCDEGTALLALAQMRHGVLADMPVEAVAAQPNMVTSLLQLTMAPSAHLRRHALACLDQILQSLAALGPGCQAGPGSMEDSVVALGTLAHQVMLQCLPLLSDAEVVHLALPLARKLPPLLAPPPTLVAEEEFSHLATPFFKSYRPLLGALATALQAALVSALVSAEGPLRPEVSVPSRSLRLSVAGAVVHHHGCQPTLHMGQPCLPQDGLR